MTGETPVRFGLTLADALAYVDKNSGWNGVLADLKYEWALAAHRALHWGFSHIGKVYSFSPVTVDLLMIFKREFGDEEVADIIDRKVRQLNYFRGRMAVSEICRIMEKTPAFQSAGVVPTCVAISPTL
jgi:hypothetical protein